MVYVGLQNDDDDSLESLCPTLTFSQRIIAFAVCLGFGALTSCLAFYCLFQKEYIEFGVLNTIANLFALGSSLFLAGPKKQMKKMFEETRWIATTVYLVTMVLTFIAALWIKSPALTILMVIIQYLAMIWYGLSYIPYARTVVKKMLGLG